MLKLTDSGCGQHSPQQITLTGPAAALVARLMLNLPPAVGQGPTYICEQGHTHCLTIHQRQEKMTSSSPGCWSGGRQGLNRARPQSPRFKLPRNAPDLLS